MSQFFISDLHLSPARPDLKQAYFEFCDTYLCENNSLTILGDFFDAWIGDDEDQDFYQQIKAQLLGLNKKNISVYFMHGNRDFLVGEQFAKDTKVKLLSDPTVIELAGECCLLMHGDSLCTDDEEYMRFRAQVRSDAWQQQILAMPLPERRKLADDLRAKSKSMNSNKPEDIMDVSQSAVHDAFSASNATKIIHGHTHRPARHQYSLNNHATDLKLQSAQAMQKHERIVLGDWDKTGWFLKVHKNKMDLIEFDI